MSGQSLNHQHVIGGCAYPAAGQQDRYATTTQSFPSANPHRGLV
jgi:hypothetical protein